MYFRSHFGSSTALEEGLQHALPIQKLLLLMEPPFDDVATRVLALSGTALRIIAGRRGQHYVTLRDATFKNRKLLPSGIVKQLSDLSTAATVMRHYTGPWACDFVKRLEDGLKCVGEMSTTNTWASSDGQEPTEVPAHMIQEDIVHDQGTSQQECYSQQQVGGDEGATVPKVQELYMGDEVSVGVQTVHDLQNTLGDEVSVGVQTMHDNQNTTAKPQTKIQENRGLNQRGS